MPTFACQMHIVTLVLACLTCTGYGRRVQSSVQQTSDSSVSQISAFNPAAAFRPFGQGLHAPAGKAHSHLTALAAQSAVADRIRVLSMSEEPAGTTSAGDIEPVDAVQRWVRKQTFNTLLPREELIQAIKELREDKDFFERQRPAFNNISDKLEAQLRAETRTAQELLGPEASERLLKGLERIDGDEQSVRTFLRTPAVEGIVGSLLYEGIFQFVQTVDLLGNIVNQLPVIGPIRQQIVQAFKKSLDQTLGRQVKSFLGSYSRQSTEQLVGLVLSKENAARFADSRRKLGTELLKRPVSSILPDEKTTAKVRESAWDLLQDQLTLLEDGDLINRAYDRFGDESLEGLGVEEVTEGPLYDTTNRLLWRFLDSEEGKQFIETAKRK